MAITAEFTADFSDFVRGTQQATDSLKDVEKGSKAAADQSSASFTSMKSMALDVAGAFGIAFSVGAVVSFGQELFATTAALEGMSKATSITTDDLQKLGYVGNEFGLTVPQITGAVSALSDRLASGDTSAAAAVARLGLSIDDLIAAGPTEAFLQLTDAAGRIEDPMQKAATASDLFGTQIGKTLVPALGELRTKMNEVPQDAIISEETIASAAKFDTTLKNLWTRLKAGAAEAVASAIGNIQSLRVAFETDFSNAGVSAAEMNKKLMAMAEDGLPAVAEATKPVLTAAQQMTNALEAWRKEGVEPLNAAQQEGILLGLEIGKSETEIAGVVKASIGAVHQYAAAHKQRAIDVKAAIADETKAQEAYADLEARMHREALKHFEAEEKAKAKQLEATNKAVLDGNAQIMAASATLKDMQMRASLDTTTYQIMKIWEKAEAEIAAFKGTEQQVATHAELMYTIADQEARAITDVMKSASDQMVTMATGALSQVMEEAQAAVATMQGGTQLPGSSRTTAPGGGSYLVSPEGNRVPLGPHGELPANWFELYSGKTSFGRAAGGPVSAGNPYTVGERGPELFVPGRSGSIQPSGAGAGVTNIYITQPLGDPATIARAVEDAMSRSLRTSGVRLPAGA